MSDAYRVRNPLGYCLACGSEWSLSPGEGCTNPGDHDATRPAGPPPDERPARCAACRHEAHNPGRCAAPACDCQWWPPRASQSDAPPSGPDPTNAAPPPVCPHCHGWLDRPFSHHRACPNWREAPTAPVGPPAGEAASRRDAALRALVDAYGAAVFSHGRASCSVDDRWAQTCGMRSGEAYDALLAAVERLTRERDEWRAIAEGSHKAQVAGLERETALARHLRAAEAERDALRAECSAQQEAMQRAVAILRICGDGPGAYASEVLREALGAPVATPEAP